ncbi:MAG TPA: hypothetical protein VK674_07100 [Candidatus Limnocylindria bacterium]|nr:hypothetical protein [Candidatus Limnocylindria bacterium]
MRHVKKSTLIIYSLVALVILLPLLDRGYILTLDMVFVPDLQVPGSVSSSYLLHTGLAILGKLVPSDIVQKLMLFSILVFSGFGAHRLFELIHAKVRTEVRTEAANSAAAYFAGIFYMINPYTYSRFMAGQYSVLLGYALLPFFANAWLQFLTNPAKKTTLTVVLWAVLISIVSVHSVGLIALLGCIGLGGALWQNRQHSATVKKLCMYSLGGLGVAMILSSYWLVPLVLGHNQTARTIEGFGTGDHQAFVTAGGHAIGRLGNAVRLQGFWAEDRALYDLPQERMPAWGLLILVLWVLAITGGIRFWRQGQHLETAVLGAGAAIAVFLAVGGLSGWLAGLPLLGGYREPHKFTGLLALAYAIFGGAGVAALLQRTEKRFGGTAASAIMGAVLVLPLAITPTMVWGFAGQLAPRHYPKDWFVVNQRLNQDTSNFQVLFVPWHLYMPFNFSGRTIANPAMKFFDKPILSSDDPEFRGASTTSSTASIRSVGRVLADASGRQDLGRQLAAHNIKYILLANESDAEKYHYMDDQKDLYVISQTTTLKLYRNKLWDKF